MNEDKPVWEKVWHWQRIENGLGTVLILILVFACIPSFIVKGQQVQEIKSNMGLTTGQIRQILRGGYSKEALLEPIINTRQTVLSTSPVALYPL